MRKFILLIVLSLVCSEKKINAQLRTAVGMEGGLAIDVFNINDPEGQIRTVPNINGLYGISILHDISKHTFIEAGYIRKHNEQNFGFNYFGGITNINYYLSDQFLFRVGKHLNLSKQKIFFTPVIGASFVHHTYIGFSGDGYGTITNDVMRTIYYNYNSSEPFDPNSSGIFSGLSNFYPLVQASLGLEFNPCKQIIISANTNFFQGFINTVSTNIDYSVNNSALSSANLSSNGGYLSLCLGVKYVLSNWWEEKYKPADVIKE